MNILFLDAYHEPEKIAYSHLEKDLIEMLVSKEHRISVICPTPTRSITGEERKKYRKIKHEIKYGGSVEIKRFWAWQEGKNIIMRALRYLWCNIRTYQYAVRCNDIDLIFSNSTPPTQGLLATLVKKKLKVPFVYNLQDIFPDSLVNSKMTKEGSIVWKIGRMIENYSYKHADRIITISEDFKRNLMVKGVPSEKIDVVPNWVNTDDVYPVERKDNVLVQRYNLDPYAFYICYSGNIGLSQNMELLLGVARDVGKRLSQVRFLLIGDGVAKREIEKVVIGNKLNNVIMLPFQPYEDIAHVFSIGDVGLVISKPGIGGSSVPSKTWSIMAAGRPILASFDADSELGNLIRKIDCGVIVDAGDKNGMIQAIQSLFENSNTQIAMNGYKYVKEKLNKTVCATCYADIFERVVAEK